MSDELLSSDIEVAKSIGVRNLTRVQLMRLANAYLAELAARDADVKALREWLTSRRDRVRYIQEHTHRSDITDCTLATIEDVLAKMDEVPTMKDMK